MKQFKKFVSRILFLTVMATCAQGALAQSKTVQGRVTDSSNEPLIGATVTVKGTQNTGVITDYNGNYSINVPNDKAVLVFNYIGYSESEQNVSGRTNIDVVMNDDNIGLDEVVVIGYGTQRKGDVTSAITSVKSEDFAQGNIHDAGDLTGA